MMLTKLNKEGERGKVRCGSWDTVKATRNWKGKSISRFFFGWFVLKVRVNKQGRFTEGSVAVLCACMFLLLFL